MTTDKQEYQMHRNRSLQDTGNGKLEDGADVDGKCVVQVQSRWNNIHLSLVCVLLGISLIMMLDGCRPSSESWVLLGSAGIPIWDWTSVCVVMFFTVLQVALYYLPVGQVTEGKMGCDGKRLKYKLNGLHAFLLTVVLMLVLWFSGVLRPGAVMDRIFSLVSAAMAVSLVFSLMLFLCPIRTPSSAHVTYNNTAKRLLKFVLGQSMDPRLGIIDVKHFVMVRVGFIGWGMMDVNYLLTAIETKNSSLSLLLVIIFQLIYILDFLIDEGSVLTTKEFTDEPIGFIMILGEFIWIPFFSSLPVYFLLQRPNHIHFLSAVPICLLFVQFMNRYRLLDLLPVQRAERWFPQKSQGSGLRSSEDDPQPGRKQSAGVRMVRMGPAPQLLWRHPDDVGLVSAVRLQQCSAVLASAAVLSFTEATSQ
ncbi:delta(14)-sterol reductase TM7SF2 isoform X2 [Carassius gibelio]|uniref:delta(14)-sterol reductase TM7SF2 isoform X2 n=1 Tax=Carassius gibelio TaxID=101364 RepID=UPI002277CCF6|nr:delta(14)-sterol reductase TM7SF2 isoform X2 [Carassius gibelio]